MSAARNKSNLVSLVLVSLLGIICSGSAFGAGDLLARYTFTNSTTADVAGDTKVGVFHGQTYNGLANGSPALSSDVPSGRSGNSLSLDGNSSINALYAGNGGNAVNPFSGANDYTVTSWFKTATTANSSIILSSAQDNSSSHQAMAFFIDESNSPDGRLTHDNFYVSNSTSGNSLIGLNDGQWHFGAVTYTAATNAFTFMVDNTIVAGDNNYDPGNTTNLTDTVQIGNTLNTDFPSGGPGFAGELYDVAIFTGVLNNTELASVKSGDFSAFMQTPATPVPTLSFNLLLTLGLLMGLAGVAVMRRRS